ncbi:hypothetical protein BJX76DRAFT_336421 [Aspergillus varians]
MYFRNVARFEREKVIPKPAMGVIIEKESMKVAFEKRERERKGIAALLTLDRSGVWTFFNERTCLALILTLLGLLGLVGESDPHSQGNDPSRDDDGGSWCDMSDRRRSRIRRWCDNKNHWCKNCTAFLRTINCGKRDSRGVRGSTQSGLRSRESRTQTPLDARTEGDTTVGNWVESC